MPINNLELEFTVVLTVVGGKECVRKHLITLCPQVDFNRAEVLVPYDKWSIDVAGLAKEFPNVGFQFSGDLGLPHSKFVGGSDHRLYDRRRAMGLRLSRGRIVAMTEDHARPADDWVYQMLQAHQQPYEVVGGAIENGIEHPLNRALYYCDFGRYGRPLDRREVSYLSDVNLAYKRQALTATKDQWWEAYHETSVNWELQRLGKQLFLDDRPIVFQMRPRISLGQASAERIAWGRHFAETRSVALSATRRLIFAAGSPFLPLVLFVRVFGHMRRQRQSIRKMAATLPIVFLLLIFWSVGEFIGYLRIGPRSTETARETVPTEQRSC